MDIVDKIKMETYAECIIDADIFLWYDKNTEKSHAYLLINL